MLNKVKNNVKIMLKHNILNHVSSFVTSSIKT